MWDAPVHFGNHILQTNLVEDKVVEKLRIVFRST